MFGMLSVLGELRRELIVANTRDGLAAVRARGRRGGRPTRLTPDQVQLAQRLYDAGEPTDAQIADMLTVPRSTIYGHLDKTAVGARPRAQKAVTPPSPPSARTPANRTSRACPSCGHDPTTREEATTQRADLAVIWLNADPDRPGQVLPRRHCRRYQPPTPVADIACVVCGDGPILTGGLATAATDADAPPKSVQRWLTADGWQLTPKLLCPDHRTQPVY